MTKDVCGREWMLGAGVGVKVSSEVKSGGAKLLGGIGIIDVRGVNVGR